MDFWRFVKPTIYGLRNSNSAKEEYYPYQYHLEYLDYRLRKYYPTGRKKIENLLDEIRIWNLKEGTVSLNSNL